MSDEPGEQLAEEPQHYSSERVLVAGVGNIFLGDDGFGPEVARRMLAGERSSAAADPGRPDAGILPDGVRVELSLAQVPRTDAQHPNRPRWLVPGQCIDEDEDVDPVQQVVRQMHPPNAVVHDAHGMDPVAVLASLRSLGGQLPATYVVGCQPADVTDGIGLSPPVAAAVDEAVATVRALIKQRLTAGVPSGRDG